jgi:hypothetical protein
VRLHERVYRGRVSQYPGRLVMLCDRTRVLARSDRPETMPIKPVETDAVLSAFASVTVTARGRDRQRAKGVNQCRTFKR